MKTMRNDVIEQWVAAITDSACDHFWDVVAKGTPRGISEHCELYCDNSGSGADYCVPSDKELEEISQRVLVKIAENEG